MLFQLVRRRRAECSATAVTERLKTETEHNHQPLVVLAARRVLNWKPVEMLYRVAVD